MGRIFFLILVGVCIGYLYGWRDAQANDDPAYTRALAKVGGSTRGLVQSDVDAQMNAVERR